MVRTRGIRECPRWESGRDAISGAPVTDGTEVCPGAIAEPIPLVQWYVCRTKSRTEKRVDQRLRAVGFESYLPLIEREHQRADRRKRVAVPLFPGYVFARFSLTELPHLIYTPRVGRSGSDGGQSLAVTSWRVGVCPRPG